MADVEIRPAGPGDADAVGDVWLRSFTTALPTVRLAHTHDEVRAWLRDVVLPRAGTWVAIVDGRVAGVLVVHDGWIEQLYIDPDFQRHGLGSRLVAVAKEVSPDGLSLWTFQVNTSAQRFYERHGFVAVERTDGATNEEREPDVRYAWPGRTPPPARV